MEEYLCSIDNKNGTTSDFWLFDDDYIKEIKYKRDDDNNNSEKETFIYEIDDFIENNINKKLIKKIKAFKKS
tara:strand:- start:2306 stop:2521 length:216 start_codon:yes stop_codon:yes gene_type:complete